MIRGSHITTLRIAVLRVLIKTEPENIKITAEIIAGIKDNFSDW